MEKPENISVADVQHMDYTVLLPNEMMIHIFSFLSHRDLSKNARLVCGRWKELSYSPTLWKKVVVTNDIPSKVVLHWLENSPILHELILQERNDLVQIIQVISRFCTKLVTIKIDDCRHNGKSIFIPRSMMWQFCKLVKKYKLLHVIYTTGDQRATWDFSTVVFENENWLTTMGIVLESDHFEAEEMFCKVV
ncbi:hypothetical protein JTB14_019793 [Gonioctena quinquepunctata]|nr:hypothetical protein JTB14_019793 [Gonioctena quinquepunctata]